MPTKEIDGDDIKALRVGVPCTGFYENLDPHIMKHALKAIERITSMGLTVIENDDGIEQVSMMRSDVMKPIVAYETPRCITDYLELHQFKRDFSYLVSKMQSSDSRKLMKMLTEEHRVSELAYRQALFNHRQRY